MSDRINKEIGNRIKKYMDDAIIDHSINLLKSNGYFVGKWTPVEEYKGDGSTVITCNKYGVAFNSMKKGRCIHGQPTGYEWTTINGFYPTYFMELPKKVEEKP